MKGKKPDPNERGEAVSPVENRSNERANGGVDETAHLPRSPEYLAEAIADATPIEWDGIVEESSGLRSLERIASAFRASSTEYDTAHPHDPLTAVSLRPPAEIAFRWGHLEALEPLGQGSYGEVWRARDTRLDREVALKLRAAPSGSGNADVQRFLEEARRLAQVRHPNVLAVHGADVHDGRVGLWADLVEGETLEERITDQDPMSAAEAAVVGADLCRALAAIHAAGLLHGDVKTQNVMRERGGAIVLLDFGSGRRLPLEDSAPQPSVPTGTPLASPPEVLRGETPDARADVYSLGVLLYRLVTGAYPVPATTLRVLMEKHERNEAVPLRDVRPDLPTDFVRAVEKALSARPEDRHASIGELERALGRTMVGSGAEAVVAPGGGAAPGTGTDDSPGASVAAGVATGSEAPHARPTRRWMWPTLGLAAVVLIALVSNTFRASVPPTALSVSATLFRADPTADTPLHNGDPIQVGDQLWLEVQTGEPVHVYVLDEDEAGELHVLFPVDGLDLVNPLPPGQHRLPGKFRGASQDWEITSAGGRETILVVSSRNPLRPIERELAALPAATPGPRLAYATLDVSTLEQLRGVSGMRPSLDRDANEDGGRLASLAQAFREASGDDGDVWLQVIELTGE